MSAGRDKFLKRVRDLHAQLGNANENEAAVARRKLVALLKRHNQNWNDIGALLAEHVAREAAQAAARTPPPPPPPGSSADDTGVTPADMVCYAVERYIGLEEHEYVAGTLWTLHTHVFDRFMHTPRLLLTAPTKGCGKTTFLDVMSGMVARAHRSGNITAAVLYHCVNRSRSTMLLDEFDNLDLETRKTLLAVLNDGYRKGGSIDRMIKGEPVKFDVFAPVALAGIGLVPPALRMRKRYDRQLQRFDRADVAAMADLETIYRHLYHWAASVQLNYDPVMPPELRGRVADNWRPLISIADAMSPAWGERARAAAIKFATLERDEEPVILALEHLLAIFSARGAAVLPSQVLVEALIEHDDMWAEWRGAKGNEWPRKLTQGALASLLKPVGVRPKKFWLSRNPPEQARGYWLADIEAAWASYGVNPGTAEQSSGHKHLRAVPSE